MPEPNLVTNSPDYSGPEAVDITTVPARRLIGIEIAETAVEPGEMFACIGIDVRAKLGRKEFFALVVPARFSQYLDNGSTQ